MLVSAASTVVWRVLAAVIRRLQHGLHVLVFAMELPRLIKQACGCFTVRGGGGLKVRARLCRQLALRCEECLPP